MDINDLKQCGPVQLYHEPWREKILPYVDPKPHEAHRPWRERFDGSTRRHTALAADAANLHQLSFDEEHGCWVTVGAINRACLKLTVEGAN